MNEEQLETTTLPLLPLRSGVILPHMVITLMLESDDARHAVEAAQARDGILVAVPRLESGFAAVGTVAKVEDAGRRPSGGDAAVIRGLHRAIVTTGVPGTGDATWVQVEHRPDNEATSPEIDELAREYRATIENIVDARGVPQVAEFLKGVTDPGALADMAGYSPDLSFEQKIEVLVTLDVSERLEKVVGWAKQALADISLREKIRTDVTEGINKQQREFILRQQMDAIRKELGQDADGEGIVEEYRKKIAEAGMPEDVRTQAERELGRLERTSEQSPEYGWIRTYLDWMVDVPWDVRSVDHLDITEART